MAPKPTMLYFQTVFQTVCANFPCVEEYRITTSHINTYTNRFCRRVRALNTINEVYKLFLAQMWCHVMHVAVANGELFWNQNDASPLTHLEKSQKQKLNLVCGFGLVFI